MHIERPMHAVGKSYDWSLGHGAVVANPRGLAKRALVSARGERPAEWVGRYASVTFNQYGREFPNGGMNEAGLVVEIMWLASSRTPPRDGRPVVNELQFIQYLLDTSATVDDVLRAATAVRVVPVHAKVHYLACDRHGACAALEHIGGVHR
jgi:choloylglycine hydrolase